MVSIRGVKVEYTIAFALGILFLGLGIYGVFYLFTVELPLGRFSEVPFASAAGIFLGLILIRQAYPIFFPLPKSSISQSKICSSCGALLDETAEVCEKCKRKIEE